MKAFNRLVTILVLILIWAVTILLFGVPDLALSWAKAGLAWLERSTTYLLGLGPSWLVGLTQAGVIALVTAIVVLLLWTEVRRKRTPSVKVLLPSGGQAQVTAESVARRLAWHVDQLADVVAVQPTVRSRGSGVDVHLKLETAPEVDVPMKTEEVMAVSRDVVETQMGLQLRNLKVDISHAPYQETVGTSVQ